MLNLNLSQLNFLLIFLVFVFLLAPNIAFSRGVKCSRFFAADDNASSAIEYFLDAQGDGWSVRVCESPDLKEGAGHDAKVRAYWAESEVREGFLDVCYYQVFKLYSQDLAHGIELVLQDPDSELTPGVELRWMSILSGRCPEKRSDSFVLVSGISEGVFVAIHNFWTRISSSEVGFDEGFGSFSGGPVRDLFAEFRREIIAASVAGSPIQLDTISLEYTLKGSARFEITTRSGDQGWSVLVDFFEGEIVPFSIGRFFH